MAISPLALGIGLQGKYDYRQQAALEISRQKGRAKAEADAEAAKEKKRAEYRKMVSNITPKGLLPTQAKEIENDVLDAISSLEDNIDNGPEIMRKVHSIKAKQAAFEQDAKMVQGALRSSYFEGDRDSGQLIYSSDNPEDVDAVNYIPGTNIVYNKATNRYSVGDAKYKNTSIIIDEGLAKGGQTYYDLSNEQEVVDINGRKNVVRKIKPEITQMMLNDALTGSNLQSSNNDYYVYLKSKRQEIPDRRTEEGKKVFDEGRDAFLRKQIEDEVNNRLMTLGVNKPGGVNVRVDTGEREAEEPVNFTEQSEIPIGNGKFIDYGGMPNQTDVTLTIPNDGETFRLRNGEKVTKAEIVKGVYNKVALGYVAKENYNFPATYITLEDGTKELVPAKKFSKGQPLVDRYALAMAQKGKAKAGFVVFGQGEDNAGSPIELVRSYSSMGVSRFLNATNRQRAYLDKYDANAVEARNRLQKKIDSYYQGATTSTQKSKIDIPKQQGDVKNVKAAPKDAEKKAKKDERASEVMKGIKPFEK